MGEQKRSDFRQLIIPALLCAALWGSAAPCVKTGYRLFAIAQDEPYSMLVFAGCRFVLAGVLVWLVGLVRGGGKKMLPDRGSIGPILQISLFQSMLQYVLYYVGLSLTSGVNASLLSGTQTFFAVIFAHLLLKDDKLNGRKAAACLIGFAGVLVLGGTSAGFSFGWGDGMILLSAISAGMGALVSRKVTPGRDPVLLTAWQLLLGGGLLLVVGLVGGRMGAVTLPGLLLLGYMALLSAVAFTVWTALLGKYPVGRVCIFSFGIPVFGALFSAIILGENIFSVRVLLALALVSVGIAIANASPVTKK